MGLIKCFACQAQIGHFTKQALRIESTFLKFQLEVRMISPNPNQVCLICQQCFNSPNYSDCFKQYCPTIVKQLIQPETAQKQKFQKLSQNKDIKINTLLKQIQQNQAFIKDLKFEILNKKQNIQSLNKQINLLQSKIHQTESTKIKESNNNQGLTYMDVFPEQCFQGLIDLTKYQKSLKQFEEKIDQELSRFTQSVSDQCYQIFTRKMLEKISNLEIKLLQMISKREKDINCIQLLKEKTVLPLKQVQSLANDQNMFMNSEIENCEKIFDQKLSSKRIQLNTLSQRMKEGQKIKQAWQNKMIISTSNYAKMDGSK